MLTIFWTQEDRKRPFIPQQGRKWHPGRGFRAAQPGVCLPGEVDCEDFDLSNRSGTGRGVGQLGDGPFARCRRRGRFWNGLQGAVADSPGKPDGVPGGCGEQPGHAGGHPRCPTGSRWLTYLRRHGSESGYNCLSRRAGIGKPQDSDTTVRGISKACCGTRALAVVCKEGGGGRVEQE